MKNTINISIIRLILPVVILICFNYSCKKEQDIKATITVKDLSDTTKLISSAFVKIYVDKAKLQNPSFSVIDTVKGLTDSQGQFTAPYKEEAILVVKAFKNQLSGESIIRLKAGKTVSQTVYIH